MKIISRILMTLCLAGTAFTEVNSVDLLNSSETTITFAAPASVEVPWVEIQGEEWRGIKSGEKKSEQRFFHDQNQWKKFWETNITPHQNKNVPVPSIDFAKEGVVGVFRGERSTPSFDIQIVAIEKKASGLVVKYKNIDRLVGLTSPRVQVQPFHMKKIPTFDGPIRFELVKN